MNRLSNKFQAQTLFSERPSNICKPLQHPGDQLKRKGTVNLQIHWDCSFFGIRIHHIVTLQLKLVTQECRFRSTLCSNTPLLQSRTSNTPSKPLKKEKIIHPFHLSCILPFNNTRTREVISDQNKALSMAEMTFYGSLLPPWSPNV